MTLSGFVHFTESLPERKSLFVKFHTIHSFG